MMLCTPRLCLLLCLIIATTGKTAVEGLFRRRNSLDSNPIATQMLQDHERRLTCLESDIARLQIQLSALETAPTERLTREDFVSASSSLRRGQQNRPRPRVERLQSDTTTSRSPLRA